MDKIRIFEAFAGYGSQSMAMQRLKEKFGLDYEIVGISEIDKYAIQAYNAVHPGVKNYGDISKIDWNEVPDFDLFTYSFPCTDISSAGQQKGLEKGSGTRSSLLWECQKAIEIKRPKYCLMENVDALVSVKFLPYYLEWERLMTRYGYTNYNKVLNAKNYGIPQNRERIFMVSIHNADKSYYWPEPFKLEKRLKDVLEQNVDERYYLSQHAIDMFNTHQKRSEEAGNGFGWKPTTGGGNLYLLDTYNQASTRRYCLYHYNKNKRFQSSLHIYKRKNERIKYVGQMSSSQNSRVIDPSGISYAVTNGHKDGEPKIIEPIGCAMRGRNPENPSERGRSNGKYKQRIEMGSNISNTITSVQKDSLVAEPLCIPQATEQGYVEVPQGAVFDGSYPNSKTRRGRLQDGGQTSPTLMASGESPCFYEGVKESSLPHIRKLTERECFRLMGVSETDIDKIQKSGVSRSQQYKMAGNSIVVDILEHIFRKLFIETGQESQQLSLF